MMEVTLMSGFRFVDFEAIFNAISTPVLVLTPDFTMIATNDARLEATRMKREDTIGRSLFEVFPDNPDDPLAEGVRNLKASLHRVLRDKIPDKMAIQKYDIPDPKSPGKFEVRYWSPVNVPILDESGNVRYIVHIVEDVSAAILDRDRRNEITLEIYKRSEEVRLANLRLKESKDVLEERVAERTAALKESESAALRLAAEMKHQATTYDTLLSSSFDMLYMFDADLRLVYANPSQLKPWDQSLGEAAGKTFEQVCENLSNIESQQVDYIVENFKKALGGEVVRFRSHYLLEGRRVVMESVTSPVYGQDGKIVGITGASRDITEQVAVQSLLEKEREKLKQVAADLLKAKEEAENANALKSAFLANMSHEIRTPLGAMLGFSSLLKDDLEASERDQYIETIIRNGNALVSIIDDILDLAKVEAGKLEIENIEFSLSNLLFDTIDLFKYKAKQKGIQLLLHIDPLVPAHILTDPSRLRQILVNLIGNAVKFTERGFVHVIVRSQTDTDGSDIIDVDVKDTGIGLSEKQRQRLFQPFVQADNSMTRKFGGTGLGLVLSQRLAEALDGKIFLTDATEGEGCTFTLKFRCQIVKAAQRMNNSVAKAATNSQFH
jgi:PAS domain S-box-containing protein